MDDLHYVEERSQQRNFFYSFFLQTSSDITIFCTMYYTTMHYMTYTIFENVKDLKTYLANLHYVQSTAFKHAPTSTS